jgi:hypothetical protein
MPITKKTVSPLYKRTRLKLCSVSSTLISFTGISSSVSTGAISSFPQRVFAKAVVLSFCFAYQSLLV